MSAGRTWRIGVAGLGTVGAGLLGFLSDRPEFAPAGGKVVVTGVSARSRSRPRPVDIAGYAWFDVPSGAGDFDGDGKADVLWLNRTSGPLALWMMNGTTVPSSSSTMPATGDGGKPPPEIGSSRLFAPLAAAALEKRTL